MKTTINLQEFINAFYKIRPNNFSYEGLEVLFVFLEECENATGKEMELDVIAICCEFTEDTIKHALSDYGLETFDELNDNTIVLFVNGDENDQDSTIIYINY